MGKKKSKTRKQKQAKAIQHSKKQKFGGIQVQKGGSGIGKQRTSSTINFHQRQQTLWKHPNNKPKQDKTNDENDMEVCSSSPHSQRQRQRSNSKPKTTKTKQSNEQHSEFTKEYESLTERRYTTTHLPTKPPSRLFSNLSKPMFHLPSTPDEMIRDATLRIQNMNDIGTPNKPTLVGNHRPEWTTPTTETETKTNRYALLGTGDSDDDDEETEADVPRLELAPPSFRWRGRDDDDPDS